MNHDANERASLEELQQLLLISDSVDEFLEQMAGVGGIAKRCADQAEMVVHLRAALASRTVIDQAMGVIMGQNRCDADEAFALLRRASQNRNEKLRVVAADIVETVTGHPLADGPAFT